MNVENSMLKNKKVNPAAIAPPAHFDENSNAAMFFAILININERVAKSPQNQAPKLATKNKSAKKDQDKTAHLIVGPVFLGILIYMFTPFTFIIKGIHHMIDTIVLLLSSDAYTITAPEQFIPAAHWTALNKKSRDSLGVISRQNPSIKELRSGTYKPRLTLSQRANIQGRLDTLLKIECSLPKLMFGNNFDELRLKDFPEVSNKLVATLATMGIATTTIALAQAPVTAIHYSKNIALTDGSTPHFFISKIKESNIKFSLDVNQTDYRNDGHSFKWHCNSYEVVFYDKIHDLTKAKRSSKRSLEKDNAVQLDLFKRLEKRKKLEIVRMEVRLNKRQKIAPLFKTLGIPSNLTFKSMFKPAISKKILLHYFDEMENKRPALLNFRGDDKALFAALIVNNPDMSPQKILQLFGLQQALKLTNIRELRTMFGATSQRSWLRLMSDAQKIKLPTLQQPFAVVREQLIKFKALRLSL